MDSKILDISEEFLEWVAKIVNGTPGGVKDWMSEEDTQVLEILCSPGTIMSAMSTEGLYGIAKLYFSIGMLWAVFSHKHSVDRLNDLLKDIKADLGNDNPPK